ncbi:hypothetical protein AC792_08160 [Arthrobacter sp. RIT-PI-e]|uniref:shikimate dehydrogenase family protein n=1 Tax=Arthrobacter sp. RIT-PI-e TaxID=1681197 RepID=UPI0006A097C3|nr:hypothetical protein [Arthrobacter sp. RIT-PI-e]KNC19147.1 hypothetical protein AC792_08160 [Arthrobacter sp. RIT-PI-e]
MHALRAAVVGFPIGHSKSPALHAAAYRDLGIDCSYTALETDEGSFDDLLVRVRTDESWRGLSVTMPLKARAARSADSTTEPATALGAVNTLVAHGHGPTRRVVGHNTDVIGVAEALASAGVGTPRRPAVRGGGGPAPAAGAGPPRPGARPVPLVGRRPASVDGLVAVGAALGVTVEVLGWDTAARVLGSADVVVSTLPPRAADPLAAELASARGTLPAGTLLDVAYDPWPSALAEVWERRGGVIVPGLDMLLHQAVEQVRLFFPDVPQERHRVFEVMCDAVGASRR